MSEVDEKSNVWVKWVLAAVAAVVVLVIGLVLSVVAAIAAISGASASHPSSGPGGSNYPVGVEPGPWGGWSNGFIPRETLKPIPWATAYVLRSDATDALTALNEAFKAKFGGDIWISDAYRDYASQEYEKARWCSLGNCGNAADPGTSNHGWALAVDLGSGIASFSTDEYAWMQQNGPIYGWRHPAWAEPDGAHPEPWHWEFWGWAGAAGGSGTGDAKQYALQQLGGDPVQFSCLERLWNGESNWNPHAEGEMTELGRAYGIPQSLPGDKMASAGADWRDNAITQVKWGLSYIQDRYGTPCDAWNIWSARDPHWY